MADMEKVSENSEFAGVLSPESEWLAAGEASSLLCIRDDNEGEEKGDSGRQRERNIRPSVGRKVLALSTF